MGVHGDTRSLDYSSDVVQGHIAEQVLRVVSWVSLHGWFVICLTLDCLNHDPDYPLVTS